MAEATIQCRDLTKSFGGLMVIEELMLNLEPGKVTALVGPNGAGKSTLFHLITGFLAPDHGEIRYRKHRIDGLPPHSIARLGIGRLFQDVRVFDKLTALDNVLVGFPGQIGENPTYALLRPRAVGRQETTNRAAARHWLDVVGLGDHIETSAQALSYGQRKLLAIARLLALGSDVLLLDEPTAGVHPGTVGTLVRLIRALASEGKTVAVIEHNMNVVMESADWVYFMDAGEIVAFGLPDEVLGNRSIRAIYLGL